MSTWLQAISTGQRGGAAIETTTTIEEAFAECALTTPPGPTPLWGPGSILGCWADVCGFLKPPESDRYWKVRHHGAFSIPHQALGLRPTDQSCHHETWLHLEFVDWRSALSHHGGHDRRILLKERPAPYHHGQQKRRISDISVLCGTCTSSPSDLMTLPFQFISTHASVPFLPRSFPLLISFISHTHPPRTSRHGVF